MFEFLKKTITGFTEKLKQTIEKKETEPAEHGTEKEKAAASYTLIQQEKQLQTEQGEKASEKTIQKPQDIRELKPKLSAASRIKKAIIGKTAIQEQDIKELLWELELALLEADVEQQTATDICERIKKHLTGKQIGRTEDTEKTLKHEIKQALKEIMETSTIDLEKQIRGKKEKPYKILFLGPNGAGKTTTIAKIAFLLQKKGIRSVLAASDTFRAASIEQLEKHSEKLGARIVKHQYGSDPTAVAFDAVKAAQSKGIEAVLIDTAGRQETNKNLLQELKKIVRVIQPDLKLFVGESYSGQAFLQQAREFDKEIGVDGFVITKIDTDAKGGTAISILHSLKKPIVFIGTGQEYEQLQEFRKEFILDRIIA